ncbi:hypothetical protein BDY24DRAFT_341304 [Mrakia frigida]|uniref:uncharacterized protein n=1 Tax=Mrakia frigida TaxID=29902 RepID=UPI003FCC2372
MEPFLLPRHSDDHPLPPSSTSRKTSTSTVAAGDLPLASSSSSSSVLPHLSARIDLDPDAIDDLLPQTDQPQASTDIDVPATTSTTVGKTGGKRWREDDDEAENCCICLQEVKDRTVMVGCGHDNFCFSCLCVWTDQSRKCPLCSHPIGPYLLHNLWTPPPFLKFFLPPLASKPSLAHPQNPRLPPPTTRRAVPRRPVPAEGEGSIEQMEDEFERTVERRRELYRWGLLVKHVASNNVTRYRPVPTPQAFAANPDMISKATIWMRREFRVWSGVDVEFMLTYTLSLMKSIDIRSEPAVRLLAEFLDIRREDERRNAEQFAHELYSFLRSPFRDLALYDASVQVRFLPLPSLPLSLTHLFPSSLLAQIAVRPHSLLRHSPSTSGRTQPLSSIPTRKPSSLLSPFFQPKHTASSSTSLPFTLRFQQPPPAPVGTEDESISLAETTEEGRGRGGREEGQGEEGEEASFGWW